MMRQLGCGRRIAASRLGLLALLAWLLLPAGPGVAEPLLVLHERSLEPGLLSEALVLPSGQLVLASELRTAHETQSDTTGEVLVLDVETMSYGPPGPLPETASLEALGGSYQWYLYKPERGYFVSIDGGIASDATGVSELMQTILSAGNVLVAVTADFTTPDVDPPDRCGDGTCGGSESCSSCPQDCGACPAVVCGDLNVNGVVESGDVEVLRGHLIDPAGRPLTTQALSRCRVISNSDECDLLQLSVIRRTTLAPALPPGIAPVCSALSGL